jgi:hypothetical protein
MNDSTPSLTLSHEELVLILQLMKWPMILGVGKEPFPGLPQEQVRAMLRTAGHGLQARQLVAVSEEQKIQVERFAVALIAPCVAPDVSVIVSRSLPGELLPQVRYFHVAQQAVVEHVVSGPGLHTFAVLSDVAQLRERMLACLDVAAGPAPAALEARLAQETLNQAMAAARDSGEGAAASVLAKQGMPQETAKLLARTLASHQATLAIMFIRHGSPENNRSTGFGLIEGIESTWFLGVINQGQAPVVLLRSISEEDAHTMLAEALAEMGLGD